MADELLGTGVNTAAIYDRRGEVQLFPLDGLTGLTWGRVRNDCSTAEVTIAKGMEPECWADLGGVHPWGHSLVVFRDGVRVWEGPIRNPPAGVASVKLQAVDVLGWTKRRRVIAARKFLETQLASVVVEAERTLRLAYAADDPNVGAHIQVLRHATEAQITRAVEANTTMHYDDLISMCGKQGVHVTVVGRRIVLWPDRRVLGQTATLLPGKHLSGDPEVTVSGDDLCTRATTTGPDGLVGTYTRAGLPGGVDPFYGLHDRLFEGGEVKTTAPLVAQSRSAINELYPAPTILTIPDGVGLSCDAPFTISELVPGVLVPVVSRETPRHVETTLVLAGMTVTQDLEGETVAVSLEPANQLAGQS